MNIHELEDYINKTTNLASLSKIVKSKNISLYNEIISSWVFKDSSFSFVEQVYYYIKKTSIYCKYGTRMTFNGYHSGYSCKKHCQCVRDKHKKTMLEKYGVEHALQSSNIKDKFKKTLLENYGHDNLNNAFKKKREKTNIEKYGVKNPLESKSIRVKTNNTYATRYKYDNPFSLFNSEEYREKYRIKSYETYKQNNPDKYNYELIYDTLKNHSYTKSSDILGLYPSHLKKVAITQGWDDLLPKVSSYERLIADFLNKNNISYISNTRKIIPPYELDFFIPSYNIAIEINGLKWHSENFGGKGKDYHITKTNMCNKKNIKLIHIFEDEFNKYESTVFSILKTYLNIEKKKIYARKCSAIKLDINTVRDFCNAHHLQGYTSSSEKFGLLYNDELISVMTFKKNNSLWELSRYCVHPDFQIVGGAKKLFSRFLDIHKNPSIFTYSDNRYFSGNLYAALGFKFSHNTKCNYWYFKDSSKRYHRLGFTKKRLLKNTHDTTKTEWEIMKSLGYDRIWDCGSKKWIMNI